ncbi:MAG: ATP-grasp fold amidoligase family protein [Rhodospirillaceae bacterium]|nr:ATP-grasp fold amidoligase family protein [Rhodospirillaceae bacterium]MDE0617273.1 ATP-grasp fold amidoligase family protein [Rhodospirillaceae bacterium]
MTDKEHAKHYFSSVVGSEFVIDTYDILRNKNELEDYVLRKLPCVLKPTHSSGQAIVCINPRDPLDRGVLAKWFEMNRYDVAREQNYRYLAPKVIVEELFSEDGHTVPDDYKIFCFGGVPKMIQVDTDRFTIQSQSFYDIEWNRIPVVALYPGKDKDEPKPILLDRMLELARELSAPFPFVRVDMYATTTEIRIGELTFIPWSGLLPLQPAEAEITWGAFFDDKNGN